MKIHTPVVVFGGMLNSYLPFSLQREPSNYLGTYETEEEKIEVLESSFGYDIVVSIINKYNSDEVLVDIPCIDFHVSLGDVFKDTGNRYVHGFLNIKTLNNDNINVVKINYDVQAAIKALCPWIEPKEFIFYFKHQDD